MDKADIPFLSTAELSRLIESREVCIPSRLPKPTWSA